MGHAAHMQGPARPSYRVPILPFSCVFGVQHTGFAAR